MKSRPDGNGWMLTTPILVGSGQEVERAVACQHEWADEVGDRPTRAGGIEAVIQRCRKCVAARARWRKVSD